MSQMGPFSVSVCVVAMTMIMGGCSGSSRPPISVSLSPSSAQAIDQGNTVGLSAAVMNDANSKGVLWSLSGPGSLSSTTGASITYTSPTTTSLTSAAQATVTATSVADQSKTASVQITVNPYPNIPFQTLAKGSVGQPYSQIITLTGGTAPFQWSVYNGPILTGWRLGGSVPDGLTLDVNTGTISGTPTGGGTWYFDAMATDASGVTVDNGFLSIQIDSSVPAGNPVPWLNQPLVPTSVSPGSTNFILNVRGTGFVASATVDFNNAPLATTFIDGEHLSAIVPSTDVATPGTALVTVMNPAAGGGRSDAVSFQVEAPQATVNFLNAPNSPLQTYGPLGLAAADFNEDGKPDLSIAATTSVYVFLGNGDGTFGAATGSPMFVPSPPYDNFGSPYTGPIATGDFNHSGHVGLAVGLFQNQAAVILLGNGNGTFAASSAAFANTLGQPTSDIKAADFNSDGELDLAIANQFTGTSPVALGYGRGAFTGAGTLFTTGFPAAVAVGDFDADGRLDAVVAGGGSTMYPGSGLTVSLGKGDGTFAQASGSPIFLGKNLSAMVASDFNGDGRLDLAVTDFDDNSVMILLGNGDGTFRIPISIPVGNQPDAIVAADFNRDRKVDVAAANYGDGTVTLLLGDGSGTFTPASSSPYGVGGGPYQMVAADFNVDGKLDLAITNLTDGTVSILMQQ
jgi:hypothetical protein